MISDIFNPKGFASRYSFLAFVSAASAILLLGMHNDFMPPVIIAWLLFWAIDFVSRHARIDADETRARTLMFLFLALNIIFLIGWLLSENFKTGSVLFFRRLSLFIFPILIFSPGSGIKNRIDLLLKIFVAGVAGYLLFCYGNALFNSVIIWEGKWSFDPHLPGEPWLNYFYSQEFSVGHHPSYIAMYSFLAMLISIEFLSRQTGNIKLTLLWLAAAGFLFISMYFLSSRASYLAVLAILPVFLWIKFRPKKIKTITVVSILILLALVTFFFLHNQRVSIYFDKSVDPEILKDGRIEYWKSALKVVKKEPLLGAGIGDYYKAMDLEFKNSGYTAGYYKDFNAHNQYLEILCISGITGFLVFLAIIGTMIFSAFKDRNLLYGAFIIMMLIFFSFESLLSRFAGNAFFALFAFMLIHYKGSSEKIVQN